MIQLSAFTLLLVKSDIHLQYYWVLMTGVGCVMFFGPYQMIVKSLEKASPGLSAVVRSSALYTFSWSSGLAVGPFVAAGVWGCFDPANGWKFCYGICIALSLIVIGIVILIRRYVKKVEEAEIAEALAGKETTSEAGSDPASCVDEEKKYPNLIWMAWGVGFCGYLTVSAYRALIPFRGEYVGLTTAQQGVLLAIVSAVQALTALAFIRSRTWMYKPFWVVSAGLLGMAGMLIFSLSGNFPLLIFAMVIYGIFCGTFAWLIIYHALADKKKSPLYVGVNEAIIGFCGIFAPLLGGIFSTPEKSAVPFFVSVGLIFLAMLIQIVCSWRYRKL